MALSKIPNSMQAALTSAEMPAGSVVQVKQGPLNYVTCTTTSMADLGSLSITPTASDSKILITFEQHIYVTESSSNVWRGSNVRLLRDTTEIYGDGASEYGNGWFQNDDNNRYMQYSTRHYLDYPNTTSSVAYKIQGNTLGGVTSVLYNYHGYGSGGRITLTEILV